jgi:hypothetical protein
MRRALTTAALAALAALLLALPACAPGGARRAAFQVTQVSVGFPAGPHSGEPEADGKKKPLFKANTWVPVRVEVLCQAKLEAGRRAELVVETPDSDDLFARYSVPLPAMEPDTRQTVTAYAKPGSVVPEISAYVRELNEPGSPEKTAGERPLSDPFKESAFGLDPGNYLYLTVGGRLPGLRLPGATPDKPASTGTRHTDVVTVSDVAELPTRWFGYQGIDLAVLPTGNTRFLEDFLNTPRAREALIEWVRQGGNLLVSVGVNQSPGVTNLADLQALLPMTLAREGGQAARSVRPAWVEGGTVAESLRAPEKNPDLRWLARGEVKTDRAVRVLLTDGATDDRGAARPLAVQSAYGLGRVTLVLFDLDQKPFTDWPGQAAFWARLLQESGPRVADTAAAEKATGPRGGFNQPGGPNDLATRVLNNLEFFDGVPVISFVWVALFILAYILVVGPLDYLLLKKVVKRLELTWVTFPVVVVTVSVLAYFAAYALKGNDLRVNKIDLVDIDLRRGEVYGHSWLTVFSPRIQNYSVAVRPKPEWAAAGPDDAGAAPLVSWLGQTQTGRQSFFRRTYEYHGPGDALVDVPIQVWSTKSFTAEWHGTFAKSAPPLEVDLRQLGGPANEGTLAGSVTSNLPVPLTDVQVLYGDRRYALGNLFPKTRRALTASDAGPIGTWLQSEAPQGTYYGPGGRYRMQQEADSRLSLWPVLFHEKLLAGAGGQPQNAGLRDQDESWRLSAGNRGEAVLVGRIDGQQGAADTVAKGPGTPTQLWLFGLPEAGTQPEQRGTLRQDTYVRVFVPVRAAERRGERD